MDQSISEEYLDDNAKLESKVIRALSRLQKKTAFSGKLGKKAGVSVKQIVKYLKANFCGLDGDIESQVMTALMQCIKNGLVCAINNGRYLLLGPKSKTMISSCFLRTLHGSRCCCSKKVSCLNSCCTASVDMEKQCLPKRRRAKKKNDRTESPEAECKPQDSDTLCDCCFEIHSMSVRPTKNNYAAPVRKTFTAPFDTFSPRDEVNFSKTGSKVTRKK